MARGRPRKPTALLLLNGGLAHDKKRYADRANEPVDDNPLGEFQEPELISLEEAWDYIVSLCPPGVLRHRDRAIVMRTAHYFRDQQNAQVLADLMGHPVTRDKSYLAAEKHLKSCLASLGLTPSDASRVTAVKLGTKKNDFDL
jgi:hypothetical protein